MTAALAPAPACELDEVTLARARGGDATAFRILIETYQDRVFALLWRFLGRRAQAALVDDLAQDAFLGVFRALPRFEPTGPARLSTWILTIAARTALKARRDGRDHEELDDVHAVPPPRVELRSFVDALAHAIDALPAAFRVVFLFHAYHDLDHAEIAAALDIPTGTVKSRLARARAALRASLEEYR